MIPSPQACLFDFDGTLVNSMGALVRLAGKTLKETHGLSPPWAEHLYRLTAGLPFRDQVETLFPNHPANERAVALFESEKEKRYFDHPLFEDAAETIRTLQGRGIKAIVSSNNHQALVDSFLARETLRFDLVLGYRPDFAKGERHFHYTEEVFGIPREAMIFVGDSLIDAETAAAARIAFVAKAGLYSAHDFRQRYPGAPVIHRLSELKEIV